MDCIQVHYDNKVFKFFTLTSNCLSVSGVCVTVNSMVDTIVIALMLQEMTLNID